MWPLNRLFLVPYLQKVSLPGRLLFVVYLQTLLMPDRFRLIVCIPTVAKILRQLSVMQFVVNRLIATKNSKATWKSIHRLQRKKQHVNVHTVVRQSTRVNANRWITATSIFIIKIQVVTAVYFVKLFSPPWNSCLNMVNKNTKPTTLLWSRRLKLRNFYGQTLDACNELSCIIIYFGIVNEIVIFFFF